MPKRKQNRRKRRKLEQQRRIAKMIETKTALFCLRKARERRFFQREEVKHI